MPQQPCVDSSCCRGLIWTFEGKKLVALQPTRSTETHGARQLRAGAEWPIPAPQPALPVLRALLDKLLQDNGAIKAQAELDDIIGTLCSRHLCLWLRLSERGNEYKLVM